jgi:uncharacterized protein YyaL (SSP411 family)
MELASENLATLRSRTSRLFRNPTFVVGLAFIAIVVFVQWPMLKGMFYGNAAPDDGIGWRTDFPAALSEAQQSHKPLLVDVSATWCPPCKVMKHEVWPDDKVRSAVTSGFIPVLIDPDLPANREVLERYSIKGFPTVLILDPSGTVIREANFLSRDQMLRFLGVPG